MLVNRNHSTSTLYEARVADRWSKFAQYIYDIDYYSKYMQSSRGRRI
jgi:hypothetical protein